jgi:hypothetical protein
MTAAKMRYPRATVWSQMYLSFRTVFAATCHLPDREEV